MVRETNAGGGFMKTEPRQARRRRLPGAAALVFLVVFALTASSGGAASTHPNSSAFPGSRSATPPLKSAGPNQSITVATTSEPLSLDPQQYNEPGTNSLIWDIYDALYEFVGPTLTPSLASDFPKRVDDTTWEVNLKRGIVFSNGKKFNADDVV